VVEVQAFNQAPVAMVASSALGALSLAVQGHVDVERAEGLSGPVGLYVLVIAESSERKSSTDAKFTAPIRAWEEAERKRLDADITVHKAESAIWQENYDGCRASIKRAAEKGDPADTLETNLRDLQEMQPRPPKVPHLLYADVTPEALAHQLAAGWPSAGIVSAEGAALRLPIQYGTGLVQEAEKQRRQDEQEERRKAHAEKLASESSFLNIFGKRPEAPDADRKSA
jgi:putative DNA primase/helicase